MLLPTTEWRAGRLSAATRPAGVLLGRPLTAAVVAAAAAAVVARLPVLWQDLGSQEAGYAASAWQLFQGAQQPGPHFAAAPGFVLWLSAWLAVIGFSDISLHLFSLAASAGAVLLCLPLRRVLGDGGALALAVLLALSPGWVGITASVSPDAAAVVMSTAAAALLASPHLWRWSLIAAGAAVGYTASLGSVGIWLAVSLLPALAALLWERRRLIETLGAAACLAAAALGGWTAAFTRALPVGGGAPRAAVSSGLLLLTAGVLLVLSALGALALVRRRQLTGTWGLVAAVALLLGAAALLPAPVSPGPTPALLWLSALAAYSVSLLGPAVFRLRSPLLASTAVVAAVVAVEVLAAARFSAPLRAGGADAAPGRRAAVRAAMSRVMAVSKEQSRLDRSEAQPQGGRGLTVDAAPELENYARWYLRELPVTVLDAGRPPTAAAYVTPAAATRSTPAGYSQDTTQAPASAVKLFWRADAWARITPQAGSSAAAPRERYNLLDAAQPGNRPGQFSLPVGITVDSSGGVYVVDQGNSRVQQFRPDGTFVRAWGTRGMGEGQFGDSGYLLGPTGILAARGSVWVADTWNHRIQQFNADGVFIRAWGEFVNTEGSRARSDQSPTGFFGPRGIAVGPDGNLYITDTGNKRVVVYTPDGQFVRQWGQAGTGPADLDEPVGIAVSPAGRVYVADVRNSRVQVFDLQGKPLRRWTVSGWAREGRSEAYLALDRAGSLFATDPAERAVLKFSADGKELGRSTVAASKPLLEPIGLAPAPGGGMYVVDSAAGRVVRLESVP